MRINIMVAIHQKSNSQKFKRLFTVMLVSCLALQSSKTLVAQDKNPDEAATGDTRPEGTVMQEFRKLEEDIRKKKRSPDLRKKMLESNLVRAMESAIDRYFYFNRESIKKNLRAEKLKYSNPTSPRIYYVKFRVVYTVGDMTLTRYLLIRFDFVRDPEFYAQTPARSKVLIRELDAFHHDKTK